MSENSSSGKGPLYIVIAILSLLLVGGGVGAIVYLSQKSKYEEQEKMKKMEEELDKLKETVEEEEAAEPANTGNDGKTIVKKRAKNAAAHHAVSAGGSKSAGTKVVIDGTGVRFRFAPSLSAGYLTWENGTTRSVSKGTRLTYTGETSDWYQVSYLGQTFYVSKEFSYLEF
jgi:hypothetical protein